MKNQENSEPFASSSCRHNFKFKLALILITAISAVSVIFGGLGTSNPGNATGVSWRDKSLERWARIVTADPTQHGRTVIQIGPAIVPHLLAEVRRVETISAMQLYELNCSAHRWLPPIVHRHIPGPVSQEERRVNAIILLGKLGPEARGALPALIQLLEEDSVFFGEQLSGIILSTLQSIGPDAAVAGPKLIDLLETHPMPLVATTLMKIGADPDLITPPLQRLLTNGPLGLRPEAAWVLKQLT